VRCQRTASRTAGQRLFEFRERVSPSAIVSLLLFTFLTSPVLCARRTEKIVAPFPDKPRAASRSPELQSRVSSLESAKRSGDPATIASASRSVLGRALREIAAIQLLQNLAPAAIEHYKRSLDFEDVPATRLDLAEAYSVAGRLDEALSTVTDSLVSDQANARAWYVQGRIWILKRNYKEAVNSFRRALDLQTDPASLYLQGTAFLLDQQIAGAKAAFKKIETDKSVQPLIADAYRAAGYSSQSSRAVTGSNSPSLNTVMQDARRLPSRLETPAPTAGQRAQSIGSQRELGLLLASALNDLGTAEARQERYELALAHFHEAASWKADLPGLLRNTGIAASRVENFAETIRALRPVIAENPGDTVSRALLGTALFATQSYADAVQVFAPLGDGALQSPELGYSWAASLVRTNKFAAAADLLKKLELQPLAADTLVLVAQLWSQMGNYEHTTEVCHRASQLDSKTPRAHYLAGLAFLRLNRAADASPEFESELLIVPDDIDAEYHLGFSLLQQSQNDRAVELWRKVLAKNPDHPEANYELGKELLIEGGASKALPYLESAVRLKPEFEPAHYQLQSAYRAVGRKEDADREANVYRALKAKSRNITLPPPRTLDAADPLSK
jgi:tetratricopeptide (TPR) repeat protein